MVDRVSPQHPGVQVVHVNTSSMEEMNVSSAFHINPIPASFLFDAQGKLLTHFEGGRVEEDLEEMLKKNGL